MSEEINPALPQAEHVGSGEPVLIEAEATETVPSEGEAINDGGSKTTQKSNIEFKSSPAISRPTSKLHQSANEAEELFDENAEEDGVESYEGQENLSVIISETEIENADEFESTVKSLKEETEVETEDVLKSELAGEALESTLLESQPSDLEISRQVSPDKLQDISETLISEERGRDPVDTETPEETEEPTEETGEPTEETGEPTEETGEPTEEEWSDEVWLKIAARQKALRRSRKKDDIALRKQKYPELYRSDVSIYPSYTDVELPYFVVARRRYARSLRLIQKQIKGDIEEMALLQPQALDGVRIMRTFCQGVAPAVKKDTLSPKDRTRLEYLLAGNIY